jgi:hypothetical protein
VARAANAARIIDRSDEGHRGDRPNAKYAHELTDGVAAGDRNQASVIGLDLLDQAVANLE